MPLISFSGETCTGPFYKLIQDEVKTQTCRKPRKRPIQKGDTLYLYWKVRQPKDKKPIHFIGEAYCTSVKRMMYMDFAYDEEFAHRDGFDGSWELRDWFGDPNVYGDEEYDVISFKLKEAS